jgi:hypothetical protein
MKDNFFIQRQYAKLFYAYHILSNSGGPEKQGTLFEFEHNLMCEILQRHYLPPSQDYLNYLFDYCDKEINLDTCEAKLKEESEKYLSSKPQIRIEILRSMKEGLVSIHSGLIEMNVETYVYFVFICEVFCKDAVGIDEVLKEIQIIEKKPLLHEMIYFLQSSDEPKNTLMYKELKAAGLNFIDKFLNVAEPNDVISLTELDLISVIGFSNLACAILVKHSFYNNGLPMHISLHITQLFHLIEAKPVEFVVERLMSYFTGKETFESYSLTADEFRERITVVANCHLELRNTYGQFSDEYKSYKLINIEPTLTGEILQIESIQKKSLGYFPPELDKR